MQFLRLVMWCVVAAVVYGICHDQITARICIEYFTIGHPIIIESQSPTLIALTWGAVATWWMGLILGVPFAACCRVGRLPPLGVSDALPRLGVLLAVMAIIASVAGAIGRVMAMRGQVWLLEPLATDLPRDRHVDFLTDLWAHIASYTTAAIGCPVLCIEVLWRRWRRGRGRASVSAGAGSATPSRSP